MNYLLYFLFSGLYTKCVGAAEKRFLVLSSYDSASELYSRVRTTSNQKLNFVSLKTRGCNVICYTLFFNILEPRFHNEPHISVATKKQICEDITSSYVFDLYEKYAADPYCDCLSRFVDLNRFHYPSETILVTNDYSEAGREVYKEKVFVCFAQRGYKNVKYYISEEYNLNVESEIVGRFVFHMILKNQIEPYKLAEIPAKVFTSPDFDVERLYLQRKEKYSVCK